PTAQSTPFLLPPQDTTVVLATPGVAVAAPNSPSPSAKMGGRITRPSSSSTGRSEGHGRSGIMEVGRVRSDSVVGSVDEGVEEGEDGDWIAVSGVEDFGVGDWDLVFGEVSFEEEDGKDGTALDWFGVGEVVVTGEVILGGFESVVVGEVDSLDVDDVRRCEVVRGSVVVGLITIVVATDDVIIEDVVIGNGVVVVADGSIPVVVTTDGVANAVVVNVVPKTLSTTVVVVVVVVKGLAELVTAVFFKASPAAFQSETLSAGSNTTTTSSAGCLTHSAGYSLPIGPLNENPWEMGSMKSTQTVNAFGSKAISASVSIRAPGSCSAVKLVDHST
ncbi:hypothetical protein HDU67_004361, partial [Dinochytrium kinnereticum]